MDGKSCLGIYLGKNSAVVVCLDLHGRTHSLRKCFNVFIEQPPPEEGVKSLISQIVKECAEKGFVFSEVGIAIDCSMFMQHEVHSSFKDSKQIATTVRFDAEEVLAGDVNDVGMAFEIISTDESGSKLNVFTAKKQLLSDVITALQGNNIDPMSVEPDINCLARFISAKVSMPKDTSSFATILSGRNGYFIVFSKNARQYLVRTFLRSSSKDADGALSREISLTKAAVEAGGPIDNLIVYDSLKVVDFKKIGETMNITANEINLCESVTDENILENCKDKTEFAIAYGAALSTIEKTKQINFRDDFLPYQGGKIRLQEAIKYLSISLTILLLVLGSYVQLILFQKQKPLNQKISEIKKLYSDVMMGKAAPSKVTEIASKLGSEYRRISNLKSGQTNAGGDESIEAKLTSILKAFNECAAQTGLNIESMLMTSKSVKIVGSTRGSGFQNTLTLFDTIKKNKLNIIQQTYKSKGGEDVFEITIEPGK